MASVVMLPAESGDLIADLVLGQYDFTHSGNNILDGDSINASGGLGFLPGQIAIDRSVTPNRIYVADTANSRVLGWSTMSAFATGQAASIVFGQPDFVNNGCDDGLGASDVSGIGPDSLCGPGGVAVDSEGDVFISGLDEWPRADVQRSLRLVCCVSMRRSACESRLGAGVGR
jgi:hypothetical protein